MKNIRFCIITLGCKVNQYESHALAEQWQAAGHTNVKAVQDAELVLINSCAVTAKAVAEVRNTVRRMSRLAPQAKIVLTGCAAQVQEEELATLEGVYALVPQPEKKELMRIGPDVLLGHTERQEEGLSLGVEADSAFPPFHISGYDRTRAVVKMQDGCSHRCTYCIVPLARGRSVSRPLADTVQEMERLLAAGFREIGLNGVNLRQYGAEGDAPHDFWDALQTMEDIFAPQWHGRARFRISSLEPGQLNDKALRVLGQSRLVAPHLHISLQSGSKSVLKRMGRGHYDPQQVATFMEQLLRVRPLMGLGADILTAFPGETDAEFQETMALCAALPFSYAHVFPYSKRPGTAAAVMGGQIAGPVKKERAALLRSVIAEKQQAFLKKMLHVPITHIAVEGKDTASGGAIQAEQQTMQGINEYYVECRLQEGALVPEPSELLPVRPVSIENNTLVVGPAAASGEGRKLI